MVSGVSKGPRQDHLTHLEQPAHHHGNARKTELFPVTHPCFYEPSAFSSLNILVVLLQFSCLRLFLFRPLSVSSGLDAKDRFQWHSGGRRKRLFWLTWLTVVRAIY